jgi:VanZ family protein
VADFFWFKSAHFFVYGLLTLLVWFAWRAQLWRPQSLILATWYTLCIAATLDEFHQRFVPGRGSRPMDVFIDLLAAWAVLQVAARYNEA